MEGGGQRHGQWYVLQASSTIVVFHACPSSVHL
jgi:hypothetical protein